MGKFLMIAGILLFLAGLVITLAPSIPFLGRLPGDIRYESDGVRIYFPIVTCIILSIILTVLLNLFSGWK